MEYKPVEQLRTLADLRVAEPACLTRRERLERWAEVLEREPEARLRSLGEIEFHPREERPLMRADDSPLTVAYADPVLRAAGLVSPVVRELVDVRHQFEGEYVIDASSTTATLGLTATPWDEVVAATAGAVLATA